MSCYSSENWPQRNGNKWTLELMINCTWNNQDDAGQTTDDWFQDDYQRWLCCFCMQPYHPHSVYKSSCPTGCRWWGWGELAFGEMSALPLAQLTASEIKQTFLSTNMACLLAFRQWAARPTTSLLVTTPLLYFNSSGPQFIYKGLIKKYSVRRFLVKMNQEKLEKFLAQAWHNVMCLRKVLFAILLPSQCVFSQRQSQWTPEDLVRRLTQNPTLWRNWIQERKTWGSKVVTRDWV